MILSRTQKKSKSMSKYNFKYIKKPTQTSICILLQTFGFSQMDDWQNTKQAKDANKFDHFEKKSKFNNSAKSIFATKQKISNLNFLKYPS